MLLVSAGCGSDNSFKNEPRPPVPTQLTGVITDDEVTVSPDALPLESSAEQKDAPTDLDTPIVLIISNQTQEAHTVTLKSTNLKKPVEASTPPINPLDTAQIQQSLPAGTYEISAGSEQAVEPGEQIAKATLTVKPNRQTSSGEVLLP